VERGTELKSSISRRIFFSNSLVLLIVIAIFEIVFIFGVIQFYYGGAMRLLAEKAVSSAGLYNMYLKYDNIHNKAATILSNYKEGDKAELQIVDIDGTIIASSSGFNHVDKVNMDTISKLKVGEINSWQGQIRITGEEVLAVTTPLVAGENISGYLRLVTSIEGIKEIITDIVTKALITGILILAVSLILNAVLSRTIVQPIKHLTEVSKQIAGGNLDVVAEKRYDDEIGKLADTINFMSNEIKKSNNLKNDFISSISHEIRTPLTSIRGWAETINGNPSEIDGNKQGISIILKESERLTNLVEELLDFSKFEAERIDMNFEKVDLNLLVKDVLRQYSSRFSEKKMALNCILDDKVTYVTGDPGRLRQVFINVIDNACKFTDNDGSITVKTEKTPAGTNVIVKDNGIGIPPDELPHITEKFYKGQSAKSGSGIGLSISTEIIRLHNGNLRIESGYGKGTTVTIELKQ
jgi:signal transduction histidine kinase